MSKITHCVFKQKLSILIALCFWGLLPQLSFAQKKPARQANENASLKQQPLLHHNNLRKVAKLYDQQNGNNGTKPTIVGDNAQLRADYELQMLKDPATGKIPASIRSKELDFATRLSKSSNYKNAMANKIAGRVVVSPWKARGPYNVGGRTRALALDIDNENIILAGGVSGGVWRSENAGATWQKTTGSNDMQSVTAIAQDPRPGFRNIWYYSTGERIGNSASGNASFFGGNGIYKSVDGAKTWKVLPATADNKPDVNTQFDIIFNLVVHPTTGDLYVATWIGIVRSSNGGTSFTQTLTAPTDLATDVIVTPTGTLYASIAGTLTTGNKGIFRSLDGGTTWKNITPSTFPVRFARTVLAYTPTNENALYAFSDATTNGPAFLWKHYYNPTDTSTVGGAWVNLTANIPNTSIGGSVGNLNTQTGYNLVVKVHPQDSDLVIIGGTNLYRSTNGFKTPVTKSSWIGGYSPLNNVSVYNNHHPDQHVLLFFPSNPNKALSANDGGVQLTENIKATNPGAEPVQWQSLNNGYLTTQPYTVSIDPSGTATELLAGFQDNGTWYTSSDNLATAWDNPFTGDGSYNAIADGGKTKYVSSQSGNIYRFNYNSPTDSSDNYISFTRITPAGATGFSFVHPFILDPNNDNVMYTPAGSTIWRNSNLDGIPLFTNAPATANWLNLTNTAVPTTLGTITALAVSRTSPSNRLYYGTNRGGIFKIDNANIGNPIATNISDGKGLPVGFVNCITVDPVNADRVFVIFSNYRVISIFLSNDAGNTWTNISGNLEQNVDGSGSGPSVRWLAVEGNNDAWYVGTSTGLYSTVALNGVSTVWTQESPELIGNVVVPMIKTRDDGFAAIAAHGNGVYSGKFQVSAIPKPNLTVVNAIEDVEVFKNSPSTLIDISNVFNNKNGDSISISVLNDRPSIVTASIQGKILTLTYAKDSVGIANLGLIATSKKETVSVGFRVVINDIGNTLYQQLNTVTGNRPSQLFKDFGNALTQLADDINIPQGQTWNIEKLFVRGIASNNNIVFDSIRVIIYKDTAGLPGIPMYNSGLLKPTSPLNNPNFQLTLPNTLSLTAGKYWLSVYPELNYGTGNQWFWSIQAPPTVSEAYFKDADDIFGTGAIDWTIASTAFGDPVKYDLSYALYGKGVNIIAAAPDSLTARYISPIKFALNWIDKSNNEVAFLIERSTNGTNFSARAMVGPNKTQYFDTDNFDPLLTYYYRVAAITVGDTSDYSNVARTAIPPATPIAKPAKKVLNTSFVASWTKVPGALLYLVDVSADSFKTFVPGFEKAPVTDTFITVTGLTKNNVYKYRVTALNSGGVSAFSNVITVAGVKNLQLSALCSATPTSTRRWKINNPNAFTVKVDWNVFGSNNNGSLIAAPGENIFTTPTVGLFGNYNLPNILIAYWKDDFDITRLTAAIAKNTFCSTTINAGKSDNAEEEQVQGDINLISSVWPNPSKDNFKLFVASNNKQTYNMDLFNLQGQKIYSKQNVAANTVIEINATKYKSGTYILRVQQGAIHKTIKLIKL